MQAPSFNLDVNAATEGSELSSNRIEKSGAYSGLIKSAIYKESSKGSKGIEFSFESVDGKKADYLQIWFENKDDKPLFGSKQISAIQAVLRLKTLNPKQENSPTGSFWFYPDLIDKKIGLILQKEEYFNSNNELKYKFNIMAPFNAETQQTAREMIAKEKASDVERIVLTLVDRQAKQQKQTGSASNDFYQQSANSMADLNDDIDF